MLKIESLDQELLALEDKIGTVSTALSEEEFANCLKRSVYHESTSHCIDDVKCSICQVPLYRKVRKIVLISLVLLV